MPIDASAGTLERIWCKRAHRGPMDSLLEAELVVGEGLRGSADRGGRRQITLLEREVWEDVTFALGASIDPSLRRANLYVSRIPLANTRGRILAVGSARIRIWRDTAPCERMDEVHPGLQDALRVQWSGGACGEILAGGVIRVGDPVHFAPHPSDPGAADPEARPTSGY